MRTAAGCLAYVVVFAILAAALDRWTAGRVADQLRPWVGAVAALLFTLAAATVWHWLASLRGGNSRTAILARAASGVTPLADGPVLVTGTVQPTTGSLRAPLSGRECVAYLYRMYYQTPTPDRVRLEDHPVYWGVANRPFVVNTPSQAVHVLAIPRLVDPATTHSDPAAVTRAQDWVATTQFEPVASTVLGPAGTALAMVTSMLGNDTGEQRCDWQTGGDARDPGTLRLEEVVLPVGATASVAGTWSTGRGAIVAGSLPTAGAGVVVTTGPADSLLDRHAAMPPPTLRVWVWAIALAALGCGVLWAAPRLMPPT